MRLTAQFVLDLMGYPKDRFCCDVAHIMFTAGEWKVLVTTSEDADSGTDSNVTLTVYGDADNSGPLTLGSVSTGFFYAGHTDEFDVRMILQLNLF